jgi:hypothetical protein
VAEEGGVSAERQATLHRAATILAGPAGARAAGLSDGLVGREPSLYPWSGCKWCPEFRHAYEEGWLAGAEEAAL